MLRTRALEEFNKNRKIIIREVPPVTYDEVKSFMGPYVVSNIAISKRLRHAIVELKHGHEAESAIEYLTEKSLMSSRVKTSLFKQDNLLCVENIPLEWGNTEFWGFVAPHGGIEKCFIWVDDEDKPQGYGFVEYVHNKELSDVARLELDRRLLTSGQTTRCRFVGDHVTTFDKLQSTTFVVTNLPMEFGVERFRSFLLNFGREIVRPINIQLGILAGVNMERFGAVEFKSGDDAKLMLKMIGGKEGDKMGWKASFCTPGESIDDIMKDMTSVTSAVAKNKRTNKTNFNNSTSKLVHPNLQNILKNEPKVLNDLTSVLEHMSSSNKDISSNMNSIHFQTAVLSLMISNNQNPDSSPTYNPQTMCSITSAILRSMNNNISSNNISNNNISDFISNNNNSINNINIMKSQQPEVLNRTENQTTFPSFIKSSTEDVQCLKKHLVSMEMNPYNVCPPNSLTNDSRRSSPSVSSTTEITSPWKLLPSFLRPASKIETCEGPNDDEPYPGFGLDLAHFLRTKKMKNNVENSSTCFPSIEQTSMTIDPSSVQTSRVQLLHSIDHNVINSEQPLSWNCTDISNHSTFEVLQHKEHHSESSFFNNHHNTNQTNFNHHNINPTNFNHQNTNSTNFNHHNTNPTNFNHHNTNSINVNNHNFDTNQKRKKWRPKVIEQCWNELLLGNQENSKSMPSSFSSSSLTFDPLSGHAKKKKPLCETNNNKLIVDNKNNWIVDNENTSSSSQFMPKVGSYLTSVKPHPPLEALANRQDEPQLEYVGQHQQGLGGLYVDSLLRKRKFREVLDGHCRSLI